MNCLHQMRAEVPCVNISAAVAAGGVVVDASREDHLWMVCQGDGGANSEPVLDNDIKVNSHASRLLQLLFEHRAPPHSPAVLLRVCHFRVRARVTAS